MIKNRNLKIWSSILKQKEDFGITSSILQDYKDNEWLLIGMAQTLSKSLIYILVEYCENRNPSNGIFQIAITDEEIDQYFYEARKVNE